MTLKQVNLDSGVKDLCKDREHQKGSVNKNRAVCYSM